MKYRETQSFVKYNTSKKKYFNLVWYFSISQIVGELKEPTNQAREWPKAQKQSELLKITGRKKS